jgi:hypothetical protein
MERFKIDTQTYFQTIVNKIRESVNQYNNALRQEWMMSRGYTEGNFAVEPTQVELFGKPTNIGQRLDTIISNYLEEINNDQDQYLLFMGQVGKAFSEKVKRQLKDNLKNYVNSKKNNFENAVTTITQSVVSMEQSYLQTVGRINTITYDANVNTGTDGFKEPNGRVKVLVTSGTTEIDVTSQNVTNTLDELKEDVKKVVLDLQTFKTLIETETSFTYSVDKQNYSGKLVYEVASNGNIFENQGLTVNKVFLPFSRKTQDLGGGLKISLQDGFIFRKSYMLFSDDVLDDKKYQTFKNQLIGNIINNKSILGDGATNVGDVFDAYWLQNAKLIFAEENGITKEFINHMEKTVLKNYINYTPYTKKKRVFTYTTQNSAVPAKLKTQELLIDGLGATQNVNADSNKWNGIPSGGAAGAYVSKVKLN